MHKLSEPDGLSLNAREIHLLNFFKKIKEGIYIIQRK